MSDDMKEIAARITVAMVSGEGIKIPRSPLDDAPEINPVQSEARRIANFYWHLVEAFEKGPTEATASTRRGRRP
jgi:hypothetical protein